jgi:putative heme iron utilization protein
MYLFWVAYEKEGRPRVRIIQGAGLVLARLKVSLAEPDPETEVSAYELEDRLAEHIPEDMIDRELSQREAEKLLALLAAA